MNALMSSDSEYWRTPPEVAEVIRRVAPIGLDPCASDPPSEYLGAARSLTTGGLEAEWKCSPGSIVFVNPPWSRRNPITPWIEKASQAPSPTIVLAPARTDTKWFHQHMLRADMLALWRGRIKFLRPEGDPRPASSAPFPVVFALFVPGWLDDVPLDPIYRFRWAFDEHAQIVLPALT